MSEYKYAPFGGGLDLQSQTMNMPVGRLLVAKNVEQKRTGGYARVEGYLQVNAAEITGTGDALGLHVFNGKIYVFRNNTCFEGDLPTVSADDATFSTEAFTEESSNIQPKIGSSTPDFVQCVTANIDGTMKMYCTTGVEKAFSWDGTTCTAITTGMGDDTPDHCIAHHQHLFLAFNTDTGSSLQFSPIGDPEGTWTPVTGSGEIRIPDKITGFMPTPGGDLAIFSRNTIHILSGTSSADFVLANFREYGNRSGALRHTTQQMGSRLWFLDDRGVTDLSASQKYGDFEDAVISHLITPKILQYKSSAISSCVIKEKSQYRLFFENGWGLVFTFENSELLGVTELNYPLDVDKVWSGERADGSEIILFASTVGTGVNVYEMDVGNSFAGGSIETYMLTAYNHLGSPRRRKRFRELVFDFQAEETTVVRVAPIYSLEDDAIADLVTANITGESAGLGAFVIGTDTLGGELIAEGTVYIEGAGDFIQLLIYSDSASDPVWELDGVGYHYLYSGQRRN